MCILKKYPKFSVRAICIKIIYVLRDMYKNCEKLYISAIICIEIIHVLRDMYKNCEKLYMCSFEGVEHDEKV